MLHLSTGLLQEYGAWQLATALGLFLIGLIIEMKLPGSSVLGRSAAAFGTMLCADELFMVHECLDHFQPHIVLLLELGLAGLIGITLIRRGFFNYKPVLFAGFLSTTAVALEITGKGQSLVRAEETLEIACVLFGLVLALAANGSIKLRRLLMRAIFWGTLGSAFAVLFLGARPQVCPTVDYWSKKYFVEQIW